jgi:hypothetical protein
MKIAFRGNFGPLHSTESHVAVTMELLGHQVVRIQEDTVPWEAEPVPELVQDIVFVESLGYHPE